MNPPAPRCTEPVAPIVRPGAWRYTDGRPNLRGIRIDSGNSMLFVADENLTKLALDIVNHIERRKQETR